MFVLIRGVEAIVGAELHGGLPAAVAVDEEPTRGGRGPDDVAPVEERLPAALVPQRERGGRSRRRESPAPDSLTSTSPTGHCTAASRRLRTGSSAGKASTSCRPVFPSRQTVSANFLAEPAIAGRRVLDPFRAVGQRGQFGRRPAGDFRVRRAALSFENQLGLQRTVRLGKAANQLPPGFVRRRKRSETGHETLQRRHVRRLQRARPGAR